MNNTEDISIINAAEPPVRAQFKEYCKKILPFIVSPIRVTDEEHLPTFEEMDQLKPGEFILVINNALGRSLYACVRADEVDARNIYFTCPFCYKTLTRDKVPYKNSKHEVHQHGNDNAFHVRLQYRVPHCSFPVQTIDQFYIYMTASTEGIQQNNTEQF